MVEDFRVLDRDTPMLLPASIQEWLPERHMARFVVDIVEQLELGEITSQYGGSGGKQAYHPAMLVALLFYGYATGVFSSRKLEQATYDSVAFRYISGDEHPDREAQEKIKERAQERHAAERAEYEAKLKRRQEREAATGKKPGGKPPQEPEAGPKDKDQVNFTDEESRIMPGANGEFIQGFNAQAVVEHDSHMVVGNHVSQAANDKQEVAPALNELGKVADELGKPEALVADAGYHSKENVDRCVEQDIEPYIAGSRERHNQPLEDRLTAPPECPADADAVTAMKHRLQTAEGKAIYSKRKSTVETVFGVIKEVLGFRRFHLRGLRGAEGEWSLVCTAWNLKRMYALAGG